jgi:ABC-type proline/glycine betaine transport system permease subunit
VISFGLASSPSAVVTAAPIIQGASDLLYTIPSLALFGTLITITRHLAADRPDPTRAVTR